MRVGFLIPLAVTLMLMGCGHSGTSAGYSRSSAAEDAYTDCISEGFTRPSYAGSRLAAVQIAAAACNPEKRMLMETALNAGVSRPNLEVRLISLEMNAARRSPDPTSVASSAREAVRAIPASGMPPK